LVQGDTGGLEQAIFLIPTPHMWPEKRKELVVYCTFDLEIIFKKEK
jgi:hypothetical protein